MRSRALLYCGSLLLVVAAAIAADTPPKMRIEPGKVIVPTDNMRRIWGELVSLDLATRVGTFRNESNDEVMSFSVMPYAELLHHATLGDLQDYRIGERAIFRLHPNDEGKWVWLTYIQDEMNFLNNHKEYYWVDRLEPSAGKIECTDASGDKTYTREKGIILETDADTRYWRAGQLASFADIQVGDKLRTKTHGIGRGKVRRCWEVFLDDESLLKFQAEQKQVHAARIEKEGLPGYVDSRDTDTLQITLFPEGGDLAGRFKAGAKVECAPAGADRKPSSEAAAATVSELKQVGRLRVLTLKLEPSLGQRFQPQGVARVWVPKP